VTEYTNTQIEHIIDEVIHNSLHRDILKSRLIEGQIYDDIAFKYGYSVRQIKRIVYKNEKIIFSHLN